MMARDPAKPRFENDPSETKGKRRRSLSEVMRTPELLSRTGRGKPGTGRPDDEETYRRPKQGPEIGLPR